MSKEMMIEEMNFQYEVPIPYGFGRKTVHNIIVNINDCGSIVYTIDGGKELDERAMLDKVGNHVDCRELAAFVARAWLRLKNPISVLLHMQDFGNRVSYHDHEYYYGRTAIWYNIMPEVARYWVHFCGAKMEALRAGLSLEGSECLPQWEWCETRQYQLGSAQNCVSSDNEPSLPVRIKYYLLECNRGSMVGTPPFCQDWQKRVWQYTYIRFHRNGSVSVLGRRFDDPKSAAVAVLSLNIEQLRNDDGNFLSEYTNAYRFEDLNLVAINIVEMPDWEIPTTEMQFFSHFAQQSVC